MRKTKKNGKRKTLAKIRRKLYSKRKGRGIEASKIIPSKIPISREEVLRLRRERKTLKRETRAAEKAIATQVAQEDAIINRFLTDTEAASARAVRDAAREELEKAEELIALKEENDRLKTELAICKASATMIADKAEDEKQALAKSAVAEAIAVNFVRGKANDIINREFYKRRDNMHYCSDTESIAKQATILFKEAADVQNNALTHWIGSQDWRAIKTAIDATITQAWREKINITREGIEAAIDDVKKCDAIYAEMRLPTSGHDYGTPEMERIRTKTGIAKDKVIIMAALAGAARVQALFTEVDTNGSDWTPIREKLMQLVAPLVH